jgi:hypothetical protein
VREGVRGAVARLAGLLEGGVWGWGGFWWWGHGCEVRRTGLEVEVGLM